MKFSHETARHLVERRQNFKEFARRCLFITISPNEKALHKMNGIKFKYGQLPQSRQYMYCMDAVKALCFYLSEDAEIVGTWELNQKGNVHVHMIVYDPKIKSDTNLQILRREVSLSVTALYNMDKRKKIDYMHNIVWLTKSIEDIICYLDKSYEDNKNTGMLNFYKDKDDVKTRNEFDEDPRIEKATVPTLMRIIIE